MGRRARKDAKFYRPLFEDFHKITKDAEELDCAEDISDRTFEEAVNALRIEHPDHDHDEDLMSVNTEDKVNINRLGESSMKQLEEGIVHFTQLQNFVRARDKVEPGFHTSLRDFFRAEYKKLVSSKGIIGDELFDKLIDTLKARMDTTKTVQRRAVLPIVTYLFVICDLFFRTEEERDNALAR